MLCYTGDGDDNRWGTITWLSLTYIFCTALVATAAQFGLFQSLVGDYLSGDATEWIRWRQSTTSYQDLDTRFLNLNYVYLQVIDGISPVMVSVMNVTATVVTIIILGRCGAAISGKAAKIAAASIALNPFFWLVALGPAKEPFTVCTAAASLAVILKVKLPWQVWTLFGMVFLASIFLRLELTLAIALGTAAIVVMRKLDFEDRGRRSRRRRMRLRTGGDSGHDRVRERSPHRSMHHRRTDRCGVRAATAGRAMEFRDEHPSERKSRDLEGERSRATLHRRSTRCLARPRPQSLVGRHDADGTAVARRISRRRGTTGDRSRSTTGSPLVSPAPDRRRGIRTPRNRGLGRPGRRHPVGTEGKPAPRQAVNGQERRSARSTGTDPSITRTDANEPATASYTPSR